MAMSRIRLFATKQATLTCQGAAACAEHVLHLDRLYVLRADAKHMMQPL
jgi:hypothetical protein